MPRGVKDSGSGSGSGSEMLWGKCRPVLAFAVILTGIAVLTLGRTLLTYVPSSSHAAHSYMNDVRFDFSNEFLKRKKDFEMNGLDSDVCASFVFPLCVSFFSFQQNSLALVLMLERCLSCIRRVPSSPSLHPSRQISRCQLKSRQFSLLLLCHTLSSLCLVLQPRPVVPFNLRCQIPYLCTSLPAETSAPC